MFVNRNISLEYFEKEYGKHVAIKPKTQAWMNTKHIDAKAESKNIEVFFQNTSLHGLKYCGDRKLYWFERLLFGLAFLYVCGLAGYFIFKSYQKWELSPIVIGTDSVPTFINEIPFPAITICNMNQVLKSKAKEITKGCKDYEMLKLLCGKSDEIDIKKIDVLTPESNWSKIDSFYDKVTQTCSDMLKKCTYAGKILDCSTVFEQVFTDGGMCCTFNALEFSFLIRTELLNDQLKINKNNAIPVDWTPQNGYPEKLPKTYFPRRGAGVGINMGLNVVLDAQHNEYYCSSTNGVGFKVLIHSPVEAATIDDIAFNINAGVESNIKIMPVSMKASYSLQGIAVKYRQCFLDSDEYKPYNFLMKTYTRRNCELECTIFGLLNKCQCVPYYSPVEISDSICGMSDLECVLNVSKNNKIMNNNNNNNRACSQICLPNCFDLQFEQDIVSTKLLNRNFLIKDCFLNNISESYVQSSISILNFYYTESAFYALIQQEYIGNTDFIANVGGIMGLFLGFSCISLVEVFYYSTLRPLVKWSVKWRSKPKVNK